MLFLLFVATRHLQNLARIDSEPVRKGLAVAVESVNMVERVVGAALVKHCGFIEAAMAYDVQYATDPSNPPTPPPLLFR